MKGKRFSIIFIVLMISFCSFMAAESVHANELITLSVIDGDVKEVLGMMGEQSGLNIVPDSSVTGQVTLTLTDVTAEDALQALLKVYHYNYEKVNDNTYIISEQPFKEPYLLEIVDGKLTLISQSIDIMRILNDIATKGKINLLYDQSVNGLVNANLIGVDLTEGLKSLTSANNLIMTERNEIYTIVSGMSSQQGRQMAVSVTKGHVSIDVKNGDLNELLRSIADQSDEIDLVLFGGNHQLVDMKIHDVPIHQAIEMLLSGTRYAFTKKGSVYLIGDKSINSPSSTLLTDTEVIYLKYLQAEKVPSMLPNIFPATNIKVIKELNALAVVGTTDDIGNLKEYLIQIDKKIPQIVVEAIIIQVTRNTSNSPLLKLGVKANESEGAAVLLDTVLGKLTYNSVLKLTPEFYISLENLIDNGVVTLKARPNITTLNGCQAKINVGSVQYYKTTTASGDGEKDQTQYQSINAGITLDVTPWVSSTGEITLDLHPSISSLGGAAKDGPPLVTQRQVDTTVRVKDGETIIIGGLIQNIRTDSISKVPFLGDLPWIGKLFQSESSNLDQNELIIYITPHILDEERDTISSEEVQRTIEEMETRFQRGE